MTLSVISPLSQDNQRFVFTLVDDRINGDGNNRDRLTEKVGGIEPGLPITSPAPYRLR